MSLRNAIAPSHAGGRIEIIPAAIIGGIVLAAAGGFYVWREISMPPVMQGKNVALPPAPVAPSPANAPAAHHSIPNSRQAEPALWKRPPGRDKARRGQKAALTKIESATVLESAVAPDDAIRIGHRHESGTVDPILLAAWQAYRNGDYDTALQQYSEVLRKNMQDHNLPNRDALLGMAAIAQQRSQDDVAARYYNQLLVLDPRDPYANAGMSSLPGATGAAGTESRLKLLLAQNPEAAALHFALGNHYAEQARWGDAQQAYFNASKREAGNAQFAFNLAVSLDHLGQRKLAAQHYRRALQLDSAGNTSFDRTQTLLRLDELDSH